MKAFFDEIHDNYDILNMSYEEIIELSNVIDCCKLPQRRVFHKLKTEIDNFIALKKMPKKITR